MSATVRDLAEFEALSDEIQQLAKRVLLDEGVGLSPADAYLEGWEDAIEACEVRAPARPSIEEARKRVAS